ncbi:MAG: CRISPR-associated protein Cas4 [bacterium]
MEVKNLLEAHITGTEINYLYVCTRKLWLFHHHIEMEHNSEYVELGALLHDESFTREKKDILIDNMIRIDFIDKDGILHDVKSSQLMEKAHSMQILYYLYILKQKGLPNRIGIINYPKQKRKTTVVLTDENENEVVDAIRQVQQINSLPVPPSAEFIKLCKPCSYAELCWS